MVSTLIREDTYNAGGSLVVLELMSLVSKPTVFVVNYVISVDPSAVKYM